MTRSRESEFAGRYSKLAAKLSECRAVTRFDSGQELEAWTLAHAFLDLEASFRKFVETQLPTLFNDELTPDQMEEVLLEIGEELRHILYHLRDPQFYRYLNTPG